MGRKVQTRSKGAALPYKLGYSDRPERDEKFYGTGIDDEDITKNTLSITSQHRGVTETPEEEEEAAEGSSSQADPTADPLMESGSD